MWDMKNFKAPRSTLQIHSIPSFPDFIITPSIQGTTSRIVVFVLIVCKENKEEQRPR